MGPGSSRNKHLLKTALRALEEKYRELLADRTLLAKARRLTARRPWLHIHQALRYIKQLGYEETEQLLSTDEKTLMKTIRVNTLKTSPEKLAETLKHKGFDISPHPYIWYGLVIRHAPYSPGATSEYLLGYYTLQGPASMMAVPALEPFTDTHVTVDMCAGAGVKTTQLAQHAPKAPIVAFDINRRKLAALKNNTSRLAVTNVTAYHIDARKATTILGERTASHILLDAPCSGEGLIPYPKGRWPRSFKDIINRMVLQYELADTAARLLKEGGILVYATCTISVEENEYLLTQLLRKHPELEPEPPPIKGAKEGITSYLDLEIDERLRACRRYYPHIHATEGFTICRLRRKE